MLDPYIDKPETSGEITFPTDLIQKWVIDADKEGFQIRFHAIGDGAVRLGLDFFEEAQKVNGKKDSRHALEHVEVISPNDIPRFKELSVVPSIQPTHVSLMPRTSHTTRVYEKKHPYLYPAKCLQDAGAVLAFSTDFPISPLNPMLGIYQAITRLDYSRKNPWNEQEQITLAEALKAYTIGSAYSTHRDHELGTIEPNKLADIIVLDRNIFKVPVQQILETTVKLTLMDGQVVYKESPAKKTESLL
jgi:predicted amidohydrolase YtcJ